MPPVIGTMAVVAVGLAIEAVTITSAIITVASTALAYGASYLMRPKAARVQEAPTAAAANEQRAIAVAEPIPPRILAYGTCRIGGRMYFQDNSNPWLYVGLALSDGRCKSLTAVYIGEDAIAVDGSGNAVSGSPYYGKFSREFRNGAPDQAAGTMLTGAFPALLDANFRHRGVVTLDCKYHWGTDAQDNRVLWGDGLKPSAMGEWLLVYDPRDGTQIVTDEATWKWSDNPALILAHAVTHAWGVPLPHTAIDWTSVATAATVCDATVTYGGTARKIFTAAGVFIGDANVGDQLQDMLTSFRGRITFRDGQYSILADAARTAVWTVTDLDVLELVKAKLGGEMKSTFNAISAVYLDSADAGRRTTTPPYVMAAEVAAEGLREMAITLPFTSASWSAQIIAYRELKESRDGRSLTVRLTDAALYLSPGEVVTFALAEAPFVNGDWRVEQVDATNVGAVVAFKRYSSAVYADPTTYLV